MHTLSNIILKNLLIFSLGIAVLYIGSSFFIPIALAGVLATLFLPLCKAFEKIKIPRAIASFLCLVILVLLISGVGGILGWQIREVSMDMEGIKDKLYSVMDSVQKYLFNHFGITNREQMELIKNQQDYFTNFIKTLAGSLATILTSVLFMMVYLFLLLFYRKHIKLFILRLAPISKVNEVESILYSVTRVSQHYLIGLFKMIGCLWILYGIAFSLLGVPNPFFFAVLCGILEIIPFIGNLTGTAITLFITAMHGAGLPVLGGILASYATIQLIQGWILEPLILGREVKINPLATIIALILGELIWGIPGIILAIPLTAMFKIICDNVESLKPFGFLIGETHKPKKPILFKSVLPKS